MVNVNVFRILADVSHLVSKSILIWAIHSNKSAEGVSLFTQLLYVLVFGTRYLDLFWVAPWEQPWLSYWNFVLKIIFITTSVYVVFLMVRVFARTREKEYAFKLTIWSLGGCLLTAPIVTMIFRGWSNTKFTEILWIFSIELESVCVLPQLLLLRQTSVPTVIDSFYLVTLGSYRFFYVINWIVLGTRSEYVDPVSVIFGVIQTLFYFDFAYVYWTRQRVKLRNGGVVDGDDLSKSFLVRRFIGGPRVEQEVEEEESREALARQENGIVDGGSAPKSNRWGARGISVSADDTLSGHDAAYGNGNMADPSAFEDADFDDDADAHVDSPSLAKPQKSSPSEPAGEVGSSAGQWRNEES